MEYEEFLKQKRHSISDHGIAPIVRVPSMFDYQEYITDYSIKKGRCADFVDTGLGKTIIELSIAANYVKATNKPVLIITPLAVAFQFIQEAEKFQINDTFYCRDGKFKEKIVITNYERLHYFNPNDFDCVILDESSILKNFDGATKNAITLFLKKVKYRYLFTATPSPNDFVELGTSSEALGYLGYTDMLTRFFTNNEDTISPANIGTEWILKGHAKDSFFKWVSSWSISMRKPSDLGFSDERHVLPPLNINYHPVNNDKPLVIDGQFQMFSMVAKNMSEIREESRATLEKRCYKACELAKDKAVSVYWCNLNKEGDLIQSLDSNAYQIIGSMDIDEKEEMLIGFYKGDIKKLITKASMTAFGLNWQHCGHTTYFPTYSYEQYYQAIRRFWRFGRKEEVNVDMVFSEGQTRVLESLMAKTAKANELFDKLNSNLHQSFEIQTVQFDKQFLIPKFLAA